MNEKVFMSSVTRVAQLDDGPIDCGARDRSEWQTGDLVTIEVQPATRPQAVELPSGRMAEAYPGARIVGALAERAATLETVGSWRAVGDDGRVDMMTSAGLVGRVTSRSLLLPPDVPSRYIGHVLLRGVPVRMRDVVPKPSGRPLATPVVLIIGSSMSSGKTAAGRRVVRLLKRRGLRVVGAKLTGAGRYRDVLSLGDAGADAIIDFVDGGIPSTVCPVDEYRRALGVVFDRIAAEHPDVVVAEAGASPLEPYNGTTAIATMGPAVGFTLMATADPYAVHGLMSAFDVRPDVVAGIATSTTAGIELVRRLTGLPAVNVLRSEDDDVLDAMLAAGLDL